MSYSRLPRLGAVTVLGLAVALLLGAILCIVAARNGTITYIQGFTWLRYIGYASAAVFVASIFTFGFTLGSRAGGSFRAGVAAVVLAAIVGSLYINEAQPPTPPPVLINDITTDFEDPPEFDAVVPLRPANANPIEYPGPETAAQQRRAHPEVEPITTSLPPDEAFARAVETGEAMGWNIVAQDADAGRFEAVATTTFFRFKDDVVVRVRGTPDGSRVDLRSHSRVGLSDLGKNAARIMEFRRRFLAGLEQS